MPGWFDAVYKDCANYRKRFEVFRSSLWAYKQNSLFFCTWHCLREYEQRKGKTDMAKKLTLEQKKKAVQIAIDGGNPLDYLKECGSDAPEKIWWFIKNKLKETHPDLYAQIPDRRTKKTTVKAEKKAVEKKPEKPVPQDGGEWIPAEKTEPVKEIAKEINMDYPTICCEVEPKTEISPMDLSVKVSGLCEDIKAIVGNAGTDSQVMGKAEEIIHLIRLKNCGWEHLWDAPDGSYKGRCRKCGFVTVFTEGHDTQYRYCPSCGEQKKPNRMKD